MTERQPVKFDQPTMNPGASIDEPPEETPLEAIQRLRLKIIRLNNEKDQLEAQLKDLESSDVRTAIHTLNQQIEDARGEIKTHYDVILDDGLAKVVKIN